MFEYEVDFYQNTLTVTILLLSFFIVTMLGARNKRDMIWISIILIWHTFFSFIYFLFTLVNAADAKRYYTASIYNDTFSFYPGSRFVNYLTSLFTVAVDASYLNTTLVYNLFGALGIVFLFLSIRGYLKNLSWYWALLLFIPSMSFWSSGLGKDAISYMACCLFIYSVTTSPRPTLLAILAFFSMFMVRPHIAAMFLASFIIYFIIKSKTHIVIKATILPIIATGLILSLGFVQQYVGLEEASLDSVSSYVDGRQSVNQGGGSSLDIASMSYPMQMFTYIFRPLPFEAHSAVALITSFENATLLLIFLYILTKSSFKTFFRNENLWLLMYAFLTCTMLALTTPNLGIATRQKWMFMPVLIYLLIYALHDYKTKQYKVYS